LEKGIPTDKQIEHFTVGNDRELDLVLAKYDALGSIAHAKMLGNIGLLTANETDMLVAALNEIMLMLLLEISQLKIPLKMYIRKLNIC
jgi:argininosuccinate lyase